jgi:1,4-alpha-glucan branching enzyme
MRTRAQLDVLEQPISAYEVHLGSWRRCPEESDRPLTYREAADALADHALDLGFTHVELLPVAEHPFGGSWGYQVTSYYAPTARFGTPDDFRWFVDRLHQRGLGVIVDWVPAHFPRDDWALASFDGTALYEHADPRRGAHPDWGTLVFNFGRHEVRNFLVANALYWFEEFHVDGLRVDAVASMLYLDYSRKAGEWLPNRHGGRENLEAIDFLREVNELVHGRHPGAMVVAEESTAWPSVSRPIYVGGLGFTFKWNMGWMHDTLSYFHHDPIHRRYHHNQLTFGLLYAFTENFMLPLSHDEVVHGKGSLLNKMPGDRWQQFANLRSLYGWMWAHPGKKLLFMGGEVAQEREWSHDRSIDWHLLGLPEHQGIRDLVATLNDVLRREPALYEKDAEAEGFSWIDASDVDNNVLSFMRVSETGRTVVCVANLSPLVHHDYRIGVPSGGAWEELVNTDAQEFGGSGVTNGTVVALDESWQGRPFSVALTLPPLGVCWFAPVP